MLTEHVAGAAYRGVMTVAAGVAAVASRVPGGPPAWRALADRLGRVPGVTGLHPPTLWLHAASVGELRAAQPLLRALAAALPGRTQVVSTLTVTGQALARTLPEVGGAFLLPLDAPGPVADLLGGWRPEAFLFTETEIWPTCLTRLAAAGVPSFMVSGRVSRRTAARARWLRPVFRPALAEVVCCMQTADDAARIRALGADPGRVHVVGSLKFDGSPPVVAPGVVQLAAALAGRRLVLGGSTHEGEEEALLAAYRQLLAAHPDTLLMLAPRHPARLDAVQAAIAAQGFPLVRYTTLADGAADVPPASVVLLDTIGPLAACYTLATVAFVGGSLVPVGGHNLLEPARVGCPVVVGPHTAHAADVVDALLAAGGARRVETAEELTAVVVELLASPAECAGIGERARSVVAAGRGAVARHVALITARLAGTGPDVGGVRDATAP